MSSDGDQDDGEDRVDVDVEPAEDLIPIHFDVAHQYDGWRIDRYVHACIPRLSRSRVKKMLAAQQQYQGCVIRPSRRVRFNEHIMLLRPAPDEPDVPRRFDVLYEDADIVAIGKPSGLPVHATARFYRNTLTTVLREHYGDDPPRLCHRLDRETSGLLLLAHSRRAEVALKKDFYYRRVHKRYLTIVWGEPAAPEGVIDEPIGPDTASGIRVKQAVTPDGLPARTRYRTIDRRPGFTLIEASPESGRQHQIRVHMQALGVPVVGDKLYGPDPACMLEFLETGWTESLAQRLLLPRQALHAAEASFSHPASNESMTLRCPLADDLQTFWDALGS